MKFKSIVSIGLVGSLLFSAAPAYALTDVQRSGMEKIISESADVPTTQVTANLLQKYSSQTLDVVAMIVAARPQQAPLAVSVAIDKSTIPVSKIVAVAVNAAHESSAQIVAAAILSTAVTIDKETASAILEAAISASPENAGIIAQVALSAGLSSEDVTIAAIQAGADPTAIQEATAAGVPTLPTEEQRNARVNRGSGISPD